MMTINRQRVFTRIGNSNITTQTLGGIDINKYKFPGGALTMTMKSSKMTKDHVKNFWTEVNKLPGGTIVERQNLINLTGFIMMNCLRLIKKESTCLDHQMMESGTHSFQSLYEGWLKLTIPPPGGNFPTLFQTIYPGNDLDSKRLFACLVNEWIDHKEDNSFTGL